MDHSSDDDSSDVNIDDTDDDGEGGGVGGIGGQDDDQAEETDQGGSDTNIDIPALPSEHTLNKLRFFRDPPAAARWTDDELLALDAAKKQMWSGVFWGAAGGILYGVSLAVSAVQVQSDFEPAPVNASNVTAAPATVATKSSDIGNLLVNVNYFVVGIGQAFTNLGLGLYGVYSAYRAHSNRVKQEFGEAIENKRKADEEIERYRVLLKRMDAIAANQAKDAAGQAKITASLAQLTNNVNAISTAVGTVTTKVDAQRADARAAITAVAALGDDLETVQAEIDGRLMALQSQAQHEVAKTDAAAAKVQAAMSTAQQIPTGDAPLVQQAADLVKKNQ